MSFSLTKPQLDQLQKMLAVAEPRPTYERKLFLIYEELRIYLSVEGSVGVRNPGVPINVWEFINAAADINRTGNLFSVVA